MNEKIELLKEKSRVALTYLPTYSRNGAYGVPHDTLKQAVDALLSERGSLVVGVGSCGRGKSTFSYNVNEYLINEYDVQPENIIYLDGLDASNECKNAFVDYLEANKGDLADKLFIIWDDLHTNSDAELILNKLLVSGYSVFTVIRADIGVSHLYRTPIKELDEIMHNVDWLSETNADGILSKAVGVVRHYNNAEEQYFESVSVGA